MSHQITKKLCPSGLKNNPNKNLRAINYITIHCTGNYASTATAKSHANYLYGGSGGGQMSWHYTVDKDDIYQSFDDNRGCWHAADGNGNGNMESIGIEICVNDKAGFLKACDNAAWLTSVLLKKHGLGIDRVVQHNRWSGKNCPAEIRSGSWGITWDGFITEVKKYMTPVVEPKPIVPPINPSIKPEVKKGEPITEGNLKAFVDAGVIQSPEYWKKQSILHLNQLFSNATKSGIDKRIDNGVTDINIAIETLCDANIITSPEYWQSLIKNNSVQYLKELLINITNRSKNILQRIVHAESCGEDEKGQILVANVINNRCKNKNFPNGIRNVVFQPNQFTPTKNGAYKKAIPSEQVKKSCDKSFSVDYSQGALYFCTQAAAEKTTGWIYKAVIEGKIKFLFKHGGHNFYR